MSWGRDRVRAAVDNSCLSPRESVAQPPILLDEDNLLFHEYGLQAAQVEADIANHTQPHRCLSLAAQQRDRLRSTRVAVYLSFFLHSISGTNVHFISRLYGTRVD